MSIIKPIIDVIRRQFLSGVLVVVPLILTAIVLRFLFDTIDGLLSPYLYRFIGYSIPGLGIITTLLMIVLVGFFTRSIIGASVYKHGDRVLARTPIIRIFYMAAKKLIEALVLPHNHAFNDVVMFEYPRRGTYVIGFSTTKVELSEGPNGRQKLIGVFIPSTPAPVSGIVLFIPEEDVIILNLTVEEGLKLIVSGGIATPPVIGKREHNPIAEV